MNTNRTVKIEGFLYLDTNTNFGTQPEGRLVFFRGNGNAFSTYQPVTPHTIEVEMPEGWDPRLVMVDALRASEVTARAEFQSTVATIHKKISMLLAIGNDETPLPPVDPEVQL